MTDAIAPRRKLKALTDAADAPPTKKRRTSTKKSAPMLGKCGMTKKELGDAIHDGLRIEKYEAQQTMVQTTMDATFFRSFFGVPGVKMSPLEFDETTPVVVADFSGDVGGQIFGVSKVKGGNRYTTNYVSRIVAVLYPPEEKFVMFFSI